MAVPFAASLIVCIQTPCAQNRANWTKYVIDFNTTPRDLSSVVGGFGWVSTQPLTFYLDDVVYEFDQYSFGDVASTHWAVDWIERLYSAGITGGCSTGLLNYCPKNEVTRAQMAVFLEKGLHYPTSFTAPDALPTFADTVGHWAEDWIEALKSDGITSGCAADLYCPEDPVTRAQMAVFLLKAKHGTSYSPPNATGVFTDVPIGYWADKWIEQLAKARYHQWMCHRLVLS